MNCYVFNGLGDNPVVEGLLCLHGTKWREGYFSAFPVLLDFACAKAFSKDTVREYILRLLLDHPRAGRYAGDPVAGAYLLQDLEEISRLLLDVDWDKLCGENGVLPFPQRGEDARDGRAPVTGAYRDWVEKLLTAADAGELCAVLTGFFAEYRDSGEAKYTAFHWNGERLAGIAHPDPLTFDMLGGLEYQKKALVENTRAFVEGRAANDVLLVGGSGTGKSSSVKALLNLFGDQGLRVVEVAKQNIATLPRLLRLLRHKKCRYIIFIDDLSFESPDEGYLELKVALDGQVEKRAGHILIYATSNRRRLVRESWKDRDVDDDVHENDTLHEKLSLSERFGIRLYFPVLTQTEYFDIVRLLLEKQGIAWTEEIGRMAATWATQYNGRSGRTAKQFVANYTGSR